MVLLSMLVTAGLMFGLHALRRLHVLIALAIACAASAGAWRMVQRTAALPRAMTATHQSDDAIHYPVALSEREMFLRGGKGFVRVELPSMRIAAVLPWNGPAPGVMSTVAWSGNVLLLVWHDGTRGTYAMARENAWVAEPRATPNDTANTTAYWDDGERAFVLGTRSTRGLEYRSFTFLDEAGAELRVVDTRVPSELIGIRDTCRSGDDVVAGTGFSTCRTKAPLLPGSSWSCTRGNIGEIASCPGAFGDLGGPATGWIGASSGVAVHPSLPPLLADAFTERAFDREVLLMRDGTMKPRDIRRAKDYSTLVRSDDGFVRTRRVPETEARALGHTPHDEMSIERYDEHGKLVATGGLMSPPLRWWVLRSGDEVIVVSDGLDSVARFDARTMMRRDPPDVVFALRDRLERWGGPSALYRAALGVTLATAPLAPLVIGAWLVSRRRAPGPLAKWLPRFTAFVAVIAVASLVETISRYFYL